MNIIALEIFFQEESPWKFYEVGLYVKEKKTEFFRVMALYGEGRVAILYAIYYFRSIVAPSYDSN